MTVNQIALISILVTTSALGVSRAVAQPGNAEALADEIALTEVGVANQEAASPSGADEKAGAPARVSLLDVATKLAMLVLVVYGVAWGARYAQRKGFQFVRPASPRETSRLRECADLHLRNGAWLHVLEVDGRSLLMATHGAGDVTLLLDLSADTEPARSQGSGAARTNSTSDGYTDFGLAGLDEDWEQRRDSLIRALQNARGAGTLS